MQKFLTLFGLLFSLCSWSFGQNPDLATSYYHFSLARMYELNEEFSKAISQYDKALKADPESISLRVEYSKTLWMANEIVRAVEECEKAIEMAPDNVEANHLLGKIYLNYRQKEDMDTKALEQFERVIELDPDHLESLFDAAQIELKNRNYERSADYFGRVRKLDPSSVRAYYYGAQALLALNKRDEALAVLEEGLRYSRNIPDYLLLLGRLYDEQGASVKAAEIYRTGLDQSLDPRLMEGLSKSLMNQGEFEEAIPYFRKLLKLYPNRFELKVDLARALRGSRKLDEATSLLKEVLESSPNHIEASYELGRIEAATGDREKAIERFEYLMNSTQNQAQSFFRTELALLYEDDGRYEDAIKLLKENLEVSPDDEKAGLRLFYTYKQIKADKEALELAESLVEKHSDKIYVNIAYSQALAAVNRVDEATDLLLDRMQKGDDSELLYGAIAQLFVARSEYLDAQQWVEKALSQFPDSTRLRFQLGAILERQKVYDDAEAEFKKVLGTNPNDAEVLNYLGYMLADVGTRLDEALEYIQKAVEIDPYNGAFLDSLGWVYFKQNRYEEAEENLMKAARINDSDPVIYEHLGDLYLQLGTPEKARRFYEQSLENAENEEESQRVKKKLEQLLASVGG